MARTNEPMTGQQSFEPLPRAAPGMTLRHVRVKRDWLRVRDAPSFDGRVLLELPKNTELVVLEERDSWLRVARPSGWIDADHARDVGQGRHSQGGCCFVHSLHVGTHVRTYPSNWIAA